MSGLNSSDRRYCELLACQPRSVFSNSYRFSKPRFKNKLLAVQALFTEIRGIPFTVSDPGVAQVKISWWVNELKPENAQKSQHPVVRFLIAADALNGLELPKLMDYTLAVSQLASGEPIASTEAFIKLVSKLSALEICLIFDADETEFDDAVAEALGAGQFLNRLLYHANQKVCSDSWWAPLDVQARNGITFASLSDESDSDKVEVAIVELSKMALRKLDTGLGLLDRQNKSIRNSDAFHHLILSSHIVQRRLRRLITHPQKHRDNPGGFGELMSTWRLAIKT